MAKWRYIVIHCTATPEGREVKPSDIYDWHIRQRGWRRVGYHYLIGIDGKAHILHAHNTDAFIDPWEITNGVKGINNACIHIAYVGGCTKHKPRTAKWYTAKDTRTIAQKNALETLVKKLTSEVNGIKIAGHNQFANKSCPSFDVAAWCEEIKIPKRNILNIK